MGGGTGKSEDLERGQTDGHLSFVPLPYISSSDSVFGNNASNQTLRSVGTRVHVWIGNMTAGIGGSRLGGCYKSTAAMSNLLDKSNRPKRISNSVFRLRHKNQDNGGTKRKMASRVAGKKNICLQ